jgi:hypothetical protein
MPTQPLNFGLESRPGCFGPEGGARLVNAFVEQAAEDAKNPFIIYCRPGLRTFASLASAGGFRGGIDLGSVGYIVNGATVNKVTSAGVVTAVGLFAGEKPVIAARNRKSPNAQVAFVSDGLKSILENDTVTPIADSDLPSPNGVCSIGGYFVFSIPDGRYFWTSIDEGTDIAALDFASAEANPDGLVGIIDRTQEIVLFGSKSIEFHALTGSSAVFERVPQTTLQLGCYSGAAIKSLNGIPIFPASDGTVRMLSDYSPERISNHDVERDIRRLTDKTTLTAQTFSLDGHQFYCLNCADFTWVCDLVTRKWFQWKTEGHDRWAAEGFVDIDGKMITGDHASNELYEIDPGFNADADDHLIWKLTSGPVGAYPNRVIADELYADVLTGVGINSADAHESDPKIMLRVTDDDGATWSDEMMAAVGKIGDKRKEISFHRLGASGEDGFRFELSMSAPVNRALTRAALRYTPIKP